MSTPRKPIGWKDVPVGAVALEPGNASQYHTGDWRSQRPVFTKERCIKCGICYIFCPDAAILMGAEGYPDVLLEYCKGCGICARECYMGVFGMSCFQMVEEEEFD